MLLLLAVVALVSEILGYIVVVTTMKASSSRGLLTDLLANVISSTLIFVIVYVSLARILGHKQAMQDQKTAEMTAERAVSKVLNSKKIARMIGDSPTIIDLTQDALPRFPRGVVSPERKQIIDSFLDATFRLIAALTKNRDIRIYCHIADAEDGLLHPVSAVSRHLDDDYSVTIPYQGEEAEPFVLAKAMNTRQIAAWNLPEDHADQYPARLKEKIRKDLRCVLAIPIFAYDPSDGEELPIGTISLDCSTASLEELGIVGAMGAVEPQMSDILKSTARTLHYVLTLRTDSLEGVG